MGQLFDRFDPQGPILQIRTGMEVYDRQEERVGTVTEVYLGDGTEFDRELGVAPATPGRTPERRQSILEDLGAALGDRDSLPEVARDHLLRVGYIVIDAAGLFAGECFASADQVADVQEDRVLLSIASDELIRR